MICSNTTSARLRECTDEYFDHLRSATVPIICFRRTISCPSLSRHCRTQTASFLRSLSRGLQASRVGDWGLIRCQIRCKMRSPIRALRGLSARPVSSNITPNDIAQPFARLIVTSETLPYATKNSRLDEFENNDHTHAKSVADRPKSYLPSQ